MKNILRFQNYSILLKIPEFRLFQIWVDSDLTHMLVMKLEEAKLL